MNTIAAKTFISSFFRSSLQIQNTYAYHKQAVATSQRSNTDE